MHISEVMTKNPTCCTPSGTAQMVARIMKEQDTGIVPVVENNESRKLIGVVTDRDLCLGVVAEGKEPKSVQVKSCMTDKVVSCRPEDDLDKVIKLMQDNQVRRIPVVDAQNQIVGIVSLADVVRHGDVATGQTRETLKKVSAPSGEASKPRAKS